MLNKYTLFYLVFFLFSQQFFSQGDNCSQPEAFCSAPGTPGVSFANSTATTSETGPSYGCLGTQPNPAWFFFKTTGPDTMKFNINQVNTSGTPIDVDFVCWGPFANPATMCGFLSGGCVGNHNCSGNIVDCSYSTAGTEQMKFKSPGPGSYYLVLITNYSKQPGSITFSQVSGPATDCSVNCPNVLNGDGFLQSLSGGVNAPLPATINCNAGIINLIASPNTTFGKPITPGILLSFTSNNNISNNVNFLENGNQMYCYGPATAGCTTPLKTSLHNDIQAAYLNPASTYTIKLCENAQGSTSFPYYLKDVQSGATISNGTWVDDGNCTTITINPGTLQGIATFTASCGACITSNGNGTASFNPAVAMQSGPGPYTITYTFNPGGNCQPYTFSKTVTITNPFKADWTAPNPMCVNAATINLNSLLDAGTTTGGTWSGAGITGNTFNPATSGAGTFNITYAVGSGSCGATVSQTITVNPLPSTTVGNTGPYCVGQTISLSATNGNSYSWSGPSAYSSTSQLPTRPNATVTMAGIYTVTVTSVSGCSSTGTTNVIVNTLPTVTASNTGAFCVGSSINLNASGGTSYSWVGPNSFTSAAQAPLIANSTSLMAGTYTVTATNANFCSNTATTNVTINDKPIPLVTGSSSFCSASSAVLSAQNSSPGSSPGSGSITYQWQLNGVNIPGATFPTFTASSNGNYAVIITNSNLCQATSAPFNLSVNALPSPVIDGNNSFCAGASFTLNSNNSSAGAGASIYSYQWQLNNVNIPNATNPTYTGTLAGTYNLIITNNNGCSNKSANFVVSSNAVPVVSSITGPTHVCSNASVTLTANATAGSGNSNLTYQWQQLGVDVPGATLSTYVANSPGQYQVIVTNNSNGCANSSATYVLKQNIAPTVTINGSSSFCSNSNTTLTAAASVGSGGIGTYQWLLNGNVISGATSSTYTTNSAGNYAVTVTNTAPCATTSSVHNVTVLQAPVISSGSVTLTPSNCGASSGSITGITATGSGSLTYSWVNGLPVNVGTSTTTADLLNQPAGTYNLSVSSTNTCASAVGPFNIANPTAPVAPTIVAPATILCSGGTITLQVTNPNSAYSYSWTGPNGYSSSVPNPSPLTNATPLNGGVYSVSATIAGCTGTSSSVNILVNATTSPAITGTAEICAGHTSVLSAASSTPGSGTLAEYQWQLSGVDIIGATAPTYTASVAGNYQVIVKNTNLCSNTSATFPLTVNAIPIATITGNSSFCSGSSLVLSASSSSSGSGTILTYQWQLNGNIITGATGDNYTASSPGNYQVVVTNTKLCNATSAITPISVNANPVPTVSGNHSFCAGLNTTLSAASSLAGSGNIKWYQWQLNGVILNGATNPSLVTNTPGNYSVIVTNTNECNTVSADYIVSVDANPTASITGNSNFCVGSKTQLSASTSSAGSGIIENFQWQLNGVNINNATNSTYTATQAGNYFLVVTNTNKCTNTSVKFPVIVNANPIPKLSGSTKICLGEHSLLSASASLAGSGTISSYQWLLNGATIALGSSPTYSAVLPGNYSVIVSNINDCADTAKLTLVVNNIPTAIITATPSVFCSNSSSTLDASNSDSGTGGSSSTLEYQWQQNGINIPGANSLTYTTTSGGFFSVVIKNIYECKDSTDTSIHISVNQAPNAIINGTSEFCSGLSSILNSNGSTQGSASIKKYEWYFNGTQIISANSTSYTANVAGNYSLVITDTNNCKSTSNTIVLTENKLPVLSGNVTMQHSACNSATGSLTGLNVSGSSPFNFVWTNLSNAIVSSSSTSPNLINQPAGIYLLTITDVNGCIIKYGTDTIENIGAPPAPGYTQPSAYCQGVAIPPLIAIGTGVGTLKWYSNSGLTTLIGTGTTFSPSISPTSVGVTNYYITETISGCEGLSSLITLTINPTPLAPGVSTPNPVCIGQPAPTIIATGSGGTIAWYSDQNLTNPIGSGITYTPKINSTTTIWLTEYLGACQGPATSVVVTFKPLPPSPLATHITPYCFGDAVLPLTATGTNGTLTWYSDSLLTNTIGTGSSVNPTVLNTDTFYVTETVNGCTGKFTEVIIKINPLPIIGGTPNFTPVHCGENNGSINGLTVSGGTPAYTYHWINSAGNIVGSNLNLTNVPMDHYTLEVSDVNSCKTRSNPLNLTGSGHVAASFTPSITSGLSSLSVDFNNTSVGADSYIWSFGDLSPDILLNTGATIPAVNHIFQFSGTFTVYLIAKNGDCNDTAKASITVEQSSAIQNLPNMFSPNNDGINDYFVIKSEGLKEISINIFNRWGDMVYTINSPGQAWDGKLSTGIPTSDGTYFYTLKATGYDGKKYESNSSLLIIR